MTPRPRVRPKIHTTRQSVHIRLPSDLYGQLTARSQETGDRSTRSLNGCSPRAELTLKGESK